MQLLRLLRVRPLPVLCCAVANDDLNPQLRRHRLPYSRWIQEYKRKIFYLNELVGLMLVLHLYFYPPFHFCPYLFFLDIENKREERNL